MQLDRVEPRGSGAASGGHEVSGDAGDVVVVHGAGPAHG